SRHSRAHPAAPVQLLVPAPRDNDARAALTPEPCRARSKLAVGGGAAPRGCNQRSGCSPALVLDRGDAARGLRRRESPRGIIATAQRLQALGGCRTQLIG